MIDLNRPRTRRRALVFLAALCPVPGPLSPPIALPWNRADQQSAAASPNALSLSFSRPAPLGQRGREHRPRHALLDELRDRVPRVLLDEKRHLRFLRRLRHANAAWDVLDLHPYVAVVPEDLPEERIHLAYRPSLLDPLFHGPDVLPDERGHPVFSTRGDSAHAPWNVLDSPLDLVVVHQELMAVLRAICEH